MRRRAVLKSVVALVSAPALAGVERVGAAGAVRDPGPGVQAAPGPPVGSQDIPTLQAIAEVVLPSSIGRDGREAAVQRFVSWIRNYREGADRGHSYGSSTVQAPAPALRLGSYPAQFAALAAAAQAQGSASFAALPVAKRRVVIEAALNTPAPVNNLPARPTGANLIADFMGMYFASADATDVAYNAAIGRDTCRGLDGSDKAPAPLGKG